MTCNYGLLEHTEHPHSTLFIHARAGATEAGCPWFVLCISLTHQYRSRRSWDFRLTQDDIKLFVRFL